MDKTLSMDSGIRLALGLRGKNITRQNMELAKQLSCTDIVITPFENFADIPADSPFFQYEEKPLSIVPDPDAYEYESLLAVRKEAESLGLRLAAIENFSPLDTFDILLEGQKKEVQIEKIKRIIQNVGKVKIPVIGYNFNIAGVYGRKEIQGRGNSRVLRFDGTAVETKIPLGMVWNRIYDFYPSVGYLAPVSKKEILERFTYFLQGIISVAENENITLALHPTDPPTEIAMGVARLISSETDIDYVLSCCQSSANSLTFCAGTVSEMPHVNISHLLTKYLRQKAVSYMHIRNVQGTIPDYTEVFIDEGDISIPQIINILKAENFTGFIMPDHTPKLSAHNSFETGMAYTLGYLRALITK